MVQLDGYGIRTAEPGIRVQRSEAEERRSRGRPRDDRDVRAQLGREPEEGIRGASEGSIQTASDKADLDTETRESREATAGDTDGERPSSASRTATRTGADL